MGRTIALYLHKERRLVVPCLPKVVGKIERPPALEIEAEVVFPLLGDLLDGRPCRATDGGKAALREIGHAIFKHAHFDAVDVFFNLDSEVERKLFIGGRKSR